MKKRIINLVIATLFITTAAFASSTPSILTDGTKTFVLNTRMWKSEFLSVEIRDRAGYLIFDDKYTTKENKKFNLEKLPNGLYTIVLEDELKSIKQDFVITKNNIQFLPNKITIYKPVITFEENHINLNYLSNSNITNVDIYNKNDENIFSFHLEEGKAVHKRFSTNELPKGKYTFSVVSGGNTYSKNFKK